MKTCTLRVAACLLLLSAVCLGEDPAVSYRVSLARAGEHMLGVEIQLPPGPARRVLNLPVWNALYQVRDFAQFVGPVRATDSAGRLLPIRKIAKSTWEISGAENGARLSYETYANRRGPFDAQVSSEHAFLNLAQVLMYEEERRQSAVSVQFTDLPAAWRIAVALPAAGENTFRARSYDELVDAPVEMGRYDVAMFTEDGVRYEVLVHADRGHYDMQSVVRTVRKIVNAGTRWMQDRPFDRFLFIYHFFPGSRGGGMEHANSTAIDLQPEALRSASFDAITAHEFFHAWNVKRIRPASLEPLDYVREDHTTTLWFAEGVTTTAADYIRLRAGILSEEDYLQGLANAIAELHSRPARAWQSVEQSSLETWFDKYAYYRRPDRSISYYNKGEILGVLLDLAIRDASGGAASLREMFHWINRHYAQRQRPFPETQGIQQAAEAVSGTDLSSFFHDYVEGVEELPYDRLFATVGLRLERQRVSVADAGMTVSANFDQPAEVVAIDPEGPAASAGVQVGDVVLALNGKPVLRSVETELARMRPGDRVRLQVRRGGRVRNLTFRLSRAEREAFSLADLPQVTPQQRARRRAWLSSEIEQKLERPAAFLQIPAILLEARS